ncbi:MAG: GNVR domain-containing protein [Bryobacteraceae bacterium]|jgi:polysaccharide chain length determinant protein (PEP-CTERM system associated)
MGAAQNYGSASRRQPDVEDYIDMVRRYRSWIIGPMFAGLVISVVVAFFWPDTYVSTAVMTITPQQVSQSLVHADVATQMGTRLQEMETEILSRSSLSDLIVHLDLYKKERTQKPLEDIVQDMRNRAIQVKPYESTGSGTESRVQAFAISFSYTDRYKAQQVVRELIGKFEEQNLIYMTKTASVTTEFLGDELKNAKQHLEDLDQKLTQFKVANQGKLPDQFQANVQAENAAEAEAARMADTLSQAQARKVMLEQSLQNLIADQNFYVQHGEDVVNSGGGGGGVKSQQLVALEALLTQQKSRLASMLKLYGENYPEINSIRAEISVTESQKADLEKQLEAQAASTPEKGPTKVANVGVQARLEELKNSIATIKIQIQTTQGDIDRIIKNQGLVAQKIVAYQARIEQAPLNEQEYMQLTSDYQLAKTNYESMVQKRDSSETAKDLEQHKGGENLELLDPASLPEQATDPNRPAWAAIGTALGLVIGIVLAGAKEMRDASLKNLKDVRAYTNLPVLSSIPLLENALLVRRKRRLFWLAWSSSFIVGCLAMTVSVYYHFFGRT